MSSSNSLRNYKHDITGKFKDVCTALAAMEESSLGDRDSLEIFHAIHEVLLKMVKTSKNTLQENFKEQLLLLISDRAPDLSLSLIQVEGTKIRCEFKERQVTYFYFLEENPGSVLTGLSRVRAVLPVGKVIKDFSDKNSDASFGEILTSLANP